AENTGLVAGGSPAMGGRAEAAAASAIDVPRLVKNAVLPAVAPLMAETPEATLAAEQNVPAGGGLSRMAGASDQKTGAAQVRYSGGSFDSLGAINNSKALGDAGGMLGDKNDKKGAGQ